MPALLSIGALGGTISMRYSTHNAAITPRLSGLELVASVPELERLADIHVHTLAMEPSASLDFKRLLVALRWARQEVTGGATGVVLTLGTDTLEEVAWFYELLWDQNAPLILTGAMRAASAVGSDGPANLLAAAVVALAPESRGRGVQVVLNDEIHSARQVRKAHTLALNAFHSPDGGVAGVVLEQRRVHYWRAITPRHPLPWPKHTSHNVALLEASLAADTLLLDELPALGYQGLVIAGFGAGHVSEAWAHCVGQMALKIPVVIASRTGAGCTAGETYGFAGGEISLKGHGALMAGSLCPRKARLLVWVLIGSRGQSRLSGLLKYVNQ